jgi:hypothetical protein
MRLLDICEALVAENSHHPEAQKENPLSGEAAAKLFV